MQITITAKQLQEADACESAVAIFKQVYGESATEEWTRDKQIELLKGPLGKYVGWAFLNGLLPMWSLRSANLRLADLQSADLRSANLWLADLRSANLDGAYCWSEDAPEGWETDQNGRLQRKQEVTCSPQQT